jgi:TRAP-type uncharacterized transport system substrate-binding protein
MPGKIRLAQYRELAVVVVPMAVGVLLAFWIAVQFMAPASPKSLVIAAAAQGSPYHKAAERYRRILSENGVELKVLETKGSMENLALITDPAAKVDAAFLQGGIANGANAPDLRSIGRVFYEPLWIFTQGAVKIERLSELVGKRVLIGPTGSATAVLATRLLKASGVTSETASLINQELPDYVDILEKGQADAGLLVLAPEARTVGRLFASPTIHLMNFVQADGYAQRFPFLTRVELKEGVVDFARDVPPTTTTMLTTTAALVIRKDLDAALANLLAQAAISAHSQPTTAANGETGLFQRAGAFPQADDQEFPLSPDAARVYKSGQPFLQRYLPFWLATLVDRLMVLLLPTIGVLLPAMRFAPMVYTWRVRRRILHWYRELQKVEEKINGQPDAAQLATTVREVDRIERAVNKIPIPVGFASQLYDLRAHIDIVRRRLAGLQNELA